MNYQLRMGVMGMQKEREECLAAVKAAKEHADRAYAELEKAWRIAVDHGYSVMMSDDVAGQRDAVGGMSDWATQYAEWYGDERNQW